jgi:hypothetical protein
VTTTTTSGGDLVLRWLQRENGASYVLMQSTSLAAESWTAVVSPVPAPDADQSGAPDEYTYFKVTLPAGGDDRFFRIDGAEN